MALVVATAITGGLRPAIVSAFVSGFALNYFFTPPFHRLTVASGENAFALVLFVIVAIAVSSVVDLAARRTVQAEKASAEADALTVLSHSLLHAGDMRTLLASACELFGMRGAAIIGTDGEITIGYGAPIVDLDAADVSVKVDDESHLALIGRSLAAADQRLLKAYAAHASVLGERRRAMKASSERRVLEETDRTRTALLAAVSHDLRSPLAAVKAAVSSLRNDQIKWTPEDEEALLATVEEGADRLDDLVANLLDMSRLQMGAVNAHVDEVELDGTIQTALSSLVGRERVDTDVADDAALVVADAGLLERVIANLAGNALAYASADSRVRVDASAAGDAGRDPGHRHRSRRTAGSARATLRAVPTPRRRSAWRRHRAGTRGRTRPDRGHGRYVDRRRHARWRAHVRPGPAADRNGARWRADMTFVLAVDDDPAILRTLSINLRARGYDVETAGDGRSALQIVDERMPDVVVLDLGLPDLDGVAVLKRLRAYTQVPVVVLSARHESDDKVEALDEGADDYVTKPFDMEELLARVRAAIRRSGGDGAPLVVESGDVRLDVTERTRHAGGRERTPDAHRVAHRGGARAARGPPGASGRAAARGVGTGLRPGDQLPARLPRPDPAQARARSVEAHDVHHRSRHRVPARRLTSGQRSTAPASRSRQGFGGVGQKRLWRATMDVWARDGSSSIGRSCLPSQQVCPSCGAPSRRS